MKTFHMALGAVLLAPLACKTSDPVKDAELQPAPAGETAASDLEPSVPVLLEEEAGEGLMSTLEQSAIADAWEVIGVTNLTTDRIECFAPEAAEARCTIVV